MERTEEVVAFATSHRVLESMSSQFAITFPKEPVTIVTSSSRSELDSLNLSNSMGLHDTHVFQNGTFALLLFGET